MAPRYLLQITSFWLALAGTISATTISLDAPRSYPVARGPQSIATGDFNGDGLPDMAVTGFNGKVSVLLNDGNGGFLPAVEYPTNNGLATLVAGDFNGDGQLDLAVASDGIWIFLGKGDGTFQKPVQYAVSGAENVTTGDFNADGKLDLAVTAGAPGGNHNAVVILTGQGDGTFTVGASYLTPPYLASIAAADFNGDGRLDVVLSTVGAADIYFLYGNGDGTLQNVRRYAVTGGAAYAAVGDFNGDGKVDLAVAGTQNTVRILLGKGDGTFQSPASYTVGDFPNFVTAGDVNGDGIADLVLTNSPLGQGYDPTTNHVIVLAGKGDGTFRKPDIYTAGNYPEAAAIGDFNGDGLMDLAVANSVSGTVTVLLGQRTSSFQQPVSLKPKGGASTVVVGDLNGDGVPDMVTCPPNFNPVVASVWLGKPNGTFQKPSTFQTSGGVSSMALADLNGDGKLDLAIAYLYANKVAILLGNGDGTFQAAVTFPSGGFPIALSVGDVNGDGKLDLTVANGDGANAVSILLGKGDGSFAAPVRYKAGINPSAVVMGDFNGDGKPDLAVANLGPHRSSRPRKVSVFLNKGDGTFVPAVNYRIKGFSESMVVGDFNSDGIPDIAVAGGTSSRFTILLGNGNGTFRPESIDSGVNGIWIASADFNQDGSPDLALVSGAGNVSILLRNGIGGFKVPISYSAGIGAHSAAFIEIGGKTGLVVATGHEVSILKNQGQ